MICLVKAATHTKATLEAAFAAEGADTSTISQNSNLAYLKELSDATVSILVENLNLEGSILVPDLARVFACTGALDTLH
ncbi:MAG: hypothetical protein HRT81_12805 [Henriciella sp.]|nr:hypothetical protein [Henriciella sp.]